MPFLLFIGVCLFNIPLITAFFARSIGRSFWKWFFIGCLLPVVSVFILFFLAPADKTDAPK